jgi:hypothetical protein
MFIRIKTGILLLYLSQVLWNGVAMAQNVIPTVNPNQKIGVRPYEMVWAHRKESSPPTVTFENLQGWTMQVSGGAVATFEPSLAQTLYGRPVGELRYHGDGESGSNAQILLTPPQSISIPDDADAVNMWIYGNRWTFGSAFPDSPSLESTPSVSVTLLIRDANGQSASVPIAHIDWPQWFLLHALVPKTLKRPLQFTGMEIHGGWQSEWRDIYFDSIKFYHQQFAPLHFPPLPKRNLTLFPGQSPGANTGEGKLPFPTREQTILPVNLTQKYHNDVKQTALNRYVFVYKGKDCTVSYEFNAVKYFTGLVAYVNGKYLGDLMDGGAVRLQGNDNPAVQLKFSHIKKGIVTAEYTDGTTLILRIWRKSLVMDVRNPTRRATALEYGALSGLTDPRVLYIPFLTYGGGNDPGVLLSKAGGEWVYTSIWPDWYRSNGSQLSAANYVNGKIARINGAVTYTPLTNGVLNPMYERLFITVSPSLEETLPTIANPVGLHAKLAVNRLWQESWGPDNYVSEEKRSAMLRAYGIKRLIQCNHEITWRDHGESFTLRTHAAPIRGGAQIVDGEPVVGGGDKTLEQYVAHQKSLGWLSGLYSNYSDYAPINRHWTPDKVILNPDGTWEGAWYRCWALKPLAAVQFDAEIAPRIEKRYRSDSAYTDVMTAVPPWGRTDYDPRVPGAGTFAQTFYAYGQLLRNDSRVYHGPIFSEGTYQCFYAGLPDGNYGHTYNNRPLATEPLLPVFDLDQIHTKECDIGVSWTTSYCDAIPNWQAPQNIDTAIDRFILTTMAYGHIGWLVEEQYGIERTCRSYYMLQQVQARYGLKKPLRIAYWDGSKLVGVSKAVEEGLPGSRRQLYIEYPGGLRLWLNDSPIDDWKVRIGKQIRILPPAGWAVFQPYGERGPLISFSALHDGYKADYLLSNAYIYQDGRGRWYETSDAGSNGALAIEKMNRNTLAITHISGTGDFMIARPYDMKGVALECKTYDVNGQRLQDAKFKDSGERTWITPVPNALKYVLRFSGKIAWSIHPEHADAIPGAKVRLMMTHGKTAKWRCSEGAIYDGELVIPSNAKIGEWIDIQAKSGGDLRTTRVLICSPVRWEWSYKANPEGTLLTLMPKWRLAGLANVRMKVALTASDGWRVSPASYSLNSSNPPRKLQFMVYSSLATGVKGRLLVSLEGLPQTIRKDFQLVREYQKTEVRNLTNIPYSWGICLRGGQEEPNEGNSGAIFDPGEDLSVGGVVKRGIFMHPPYAKGVGYTWAISNPIQLPPDPCEFHCYAGIRDGGDPSDGVWFTVYVITVKDRRVKVGEITAVQHEWKEFQADLSPFAGKKIRIMLKGDVGPNNNSTADWGSWGEPEIRLSKPFVETIIVRSNAE